MDFVHTYPPHLIKWRMSKYHQTFRIQKCTKFGCQCIPSPKFFHLMFALPIAKIFLSSRSMIPRDEDRSIVLFKSGGLRRNCVNSGCLQSLHTMCVNMYQNLLTKGIISSQSKNLTMVRECFKMFLKLI